MEEERLVRPIKPSLPASERSVSRGTALGSDVATITEAGSVACDATVSQITSADRLEDGGAPPRAEESTWSPARSAQLYNIAGWGCGFISMGDGGSLRVHPRAGRGPAVDLHELVESLRAEGVAPPLVLRFPDVASTQIERVQGAFASAMERQGYRGSFHGAFPVKACHSPDLVRAIVRGCREGRGRGRPYGLEVGSKGELALALGSLDAEVAPGFLLICNGRKDPAYVRLACVAAALGAETVLVLEAEEEVEPVLAARSGFALGPKAAGEEGVPGPPGPAPRLPRLGLRAKLDASHPGHWGATSGPRAKFGLGPGALLRAVAAIERAGELSALELLHYHMGSQASGLASIHTAAREAACIFSELVRLGAPLSTLDVGGGLAVDYDGSATDSAASTAYAVPQYAAAVVAEIGRVCDDTGVPHPRIVAEAGRGVAIHHAMVVFDLLPRGANRETDAEEGGDGGEAGWDEPGAEGGRAAAAAVAVSAGRLAWPPTGAGAEGGGGAGGVQGRDGPAEGGGGDGPLVGLYGTVGLGLVRQLEDVLARLESAAAVPSGGASAPPALAREAIDASFFGAAAEEAGYLRTEAVRAFGLGSATLAARARCDLLAGRAGARAREAAAVHRVALPPSARPEPLKLHANFNVFRAAIDAWGMGQVFPILPISGHEREPTVRAQLADLTCDSDGKVDVFAGTAGGCPANHVMVHRPTARPQSLAIFMTGVYQEILGSSHNLIGRMHEVIVECGPGPGLGAPAVGGADSPAWRVRRVARGHSVGQVVAEPGYDAACLAGAVAALAEDAAASGALSPGQADRAASAFAAALDGYTYLEDLF